MLEARFSSGEMAMRLFNQTVGAVLLALSTLSSGSYGQQLSNWEVGARFDGNFGEGSPANDILGSSLIGRYRFSNDWLLGFSYEYAGEWDVENPSEALAINSATVVDAKAQTTLLSVWAERRYSETERGAYWFWTAGLGISDVEADNASGTTTAGDPYNLVFDIDNEMVFTFTAGRRHNVSDSWSFGYGARLEERRGDWRATDTESGTSKVIYDGYTVYGVFADTYYHF